MIKECAIFENKSNLDLLQIALIEQLYTTYHLYTILTHKDSTDFQHVDHAFKVHAT